MMLKILQIRLFILLFDKKKERTGVKNKPNSSRLVWESVSNGIQLCLQAHPSLSLIN